jgi:PucR C-terminal helix-turn-helix domain/GGDEF-like domain
LITGETASLGQPFGVAREPSPAATAAIKELAAHFLEHLDQFVEAMHTGIDRVVAVPLLEPPNRAILMAGTRSIAARWLSVLASEPGSVPPDVPWEMFHLARRLWGAGRLTASDFRAAFHFGQNASWRLWQKAAIERSDDPNVLAEMIDVTSASMFEYVQGLSESIVRQMLLEEAASSDGENHRLASVKLVLRGGFSERQASLQLGYELSRPHTCVIVASREQNGFECEHLAARLTAAASVDASLHVCAPDGSLWIWFSGGDPPDAMALEPLVQEVGGIAAFGERKTGSDGFRRSFDTAASVQSLMRSSPRARTVAAYRDIVLVMLAGYHHIEAARFVKSTLGNLADDIPQLEDLRETMRIYLQEGENASRAAERLHTHRNTVHYRVARAQELIGSDLSGRRLETAMALELADWFGVGDSPAGAS